MEAVVQRVVRAAPGEEWRALAGDGEVGRVTALRRPDGRCFLFFGRCRPAAYEPLVTAVARDLGADLHVTVDEADGEARARLGGLGFVVARREDEYAVAPAAAVAALAGARTPPGLALVRADEVEEEALRTLDDALRQDVPGTGGWSWDAAAFREETYARPAFDPETYPVAVERSSGRYVGLARVWNNPGRPRLGLVAVLPPYRRQGLARALLLRAFAVLADRGAPPLSAGVDVENAASRALLERLGARRVGGSLELVRPAATRG
jgi:RimJ/RimL family protein N-acetyltransferase